MTATITRHIVGYDPVSERVSFEYCVPAEKWEKVLSFIQRDDDDANYLFDYALNAKDVANILNDRVSRELLYFLECEIAN